MYQHQHLFYLFSDASTFVHFFSIIVFILHSSLFLIHCLYCCLKENWRWWKREAGFGSSFPPDKSRKSISNGHVSFRKQFIKQMRWGFPWRRAANVFAFRLMTMLTMIMDGFVVTMMKICDDLDAELALWGDCDEGLWWGLWQPVRGGDRVWWRGYSDIVVILRDDADDIAAWWWWWW